MPYKHNEPRRHKIPKARYRVENWREYDVALRDRGNLTVWVTPEAIAAWHPARTGRPGRSAHYSDGVVTLPCSEREVSPSQELSGRCDCGPPRVHRRGAERAVRLG